MDALFNVSLLDENTRSKFINSLCSTWNSLSGDDQRISGRLLATILKTSINKADASLLFENIILPEIKLLVSNNSSYPEDIDNVALPMLNSVLSACPQFALYLLESMENNLLNGNYQNISNRECFRILSAFFATNIPSINHESILKLASFLLQFHDKIDDSNDYNSFIYFLLPYILSCDILSSKERASIVDSLWNSSRDIHDRLALLARSFDVFINAESTAKLEHDGLYLLISKGLVSNKVTMKRAIFVFKRLVHFLSSNVFNIKNRCFTWSSKDTRNLQDLWEEYFCVYEVFESSPEHLLQPVLSKMIEIVTSPFIQPIWWSSLYAVGLMSKYHTCRKLIIEQIMKTRDNEFFHSILNNRSFLFELVLPAANVFSFFVGSGNVASTKSEFGELLQKFIADLILSFKEDMNECNDFIMDLLTNLLDYHLDVMVLYSIYGVNCAIQNHGYLSWNHSQVFSMLKVLKHPKLTSTVHLRAVKTASVRNILTIVHPSSLSFDNFLSLIYEFRDLIVMPESTYLANFHDFVMKRETIEADIRDYLERPFVKSHEFQTYCSFDLSKYADKISLPLFILGKNGRDLSYIVSNFITRFLNIQKNQYMNTKAKEFLLLIISILADLNGNIIRNQFPECIIPIYEFVRSCVYAHIEHKDTSIESMLLSKSLKTIISLQKSSLPQLTEFLNVIVEQLLRSNSNDINYWMSLSKDIICDANATLTSIQSSALIKHIALVNPNEFIPDNLIDKSSFISSVLCAKWSIIRDILEIKKGGVFEDDIYIILVNSCVEALSFATTEVLIQTLYQLMGDLLKKTWMTTRDVISSNTIISKAWKEFTEIISMREILICAEIRNTLDEILTELFSIDARSPSPVLPHFAMHFHNSMRKSSVDSFTQFIDKHFEHFMYLLTYGPYHDRTDRFQQTIVRKEINADSFKQVKSHLFSESSDFVRVAMNDLLLWTGEENPDYVFVLLGKFISWMNEKYTMKAAYNGLNASNRAKIRIWQSTILLLDKITLFDPSEILQSCFDFIFAETSKYVRNFVELAVTRMICLNLKHCENLWKCIEINAMSVSANVSFFLILGRAAICISGTENSTEWFIKLFQHTIKGLCHSNHSIRIHATWIIWLIHDLSKSDPFLRTMVESDKLLTSVLIFTLENDEAVKLREKMSSNKLYWFHPIDSFCLNFLFNEYPRYVELDDDECIPGECFLRVNPRLSHSFVNGIEVENNDAKEDIAKHDEVSEDEIKFDNYQKKIIPWESMMDGDIDFTRNYSEKRRRNDLIVVASLVDRSPNLGGLCRTCEIFNASMLIVSNLRVRSDPAFKSLCVSADRWMPMQEVRPDDLETYFIGMKAEGYAIVAIEQANESFSLQDFKFPEKSVLFLGRETEGIPANLLQMVDYCVEIPQFGLIRSLNVHVSGALCIFEYAKQHQSKQGQ